jgi:hypothetical protein
MTTTTITQLRALTSPATTTRYFLADVGKEGIFRYDSTDKTSKDDGLNVIVSGNGKRFKRILIKPEMLFATIVSTGGTTSSGGVTPSPPVQLSTPTLSASVISSTQINLSWTNVANESSYQLERSANGSTGWSTINSPAANVTTYSNTDLTASTAYYYRIKAVGNGTTFTDSGYGTANATTSASGELTYTEVYASSYGVNKTNTAAQNDVALAAMNTALRGTTPYRIRFDDTAGNGTINFNNIDNGGTGFLNGIRDFEIINGASTKWLPTYEAPFFTNKNYQTSNGASFLMGIQLTANASAGATKLYVTSTTGFSAGVRFQLQGREKQFAGVPQNPEFYERLVVSSIGSDGGGPYVITTTPIAHSYNIAWKDFVNYAGEAYTIGKPRIWLDDNGSFHTINSAIFRGGSYGVANGTGVFIVNAYRVEVHDAAFDPDMSIWPSQNEYFLLDGTSGGNVEIDKMVGTFEMVDANHSEPSGATSCKVLKITDSTTEYTNVSPLTAIFNGHILNRGSNSGPCIYPQPEGMSTEYMSFQNCTYTSLNDDGMVDVGHTMTFTIDGTNITTNGTDILIPDNSTYNWIVKGMIYGLKLWKTDGSKFATETDVEFNGTKYVLKTTGATFVTGEEWNFPRTMYVKDLGGNVSGRAGTPFLHGNVARWKGNTGTHVGARNIVWNQNDLRWNGSDMHNITMVGHIQSITINVTTAKSGVGITIYKNGYDGTDNNRIAWINLGQTGTRTITTSGFTPLSGDISGPNSIPTGFLNVLAISTSGGSTSDLPQFTITVNNFYPYQNSAVAP